MFYYRVDFWMNRRYGFCLVLISVQHHRSNESTFLLLKTTFDLVHWLPINFLLQQNNKVLLVFDYKNEVGCKFLAALVDQSISEFTGQLLNYWFPLQWERSTSLYPNRGALRCNYNSYELIILHQVMFCFSQGEVSLLLLASKTSWLLCRLLIPFSEEQETWCFYLCIVIIQGHMLLAAA